jgi:hypothetical protein
MTATSELPEWHATTSSVDRHPKLPDDILLGRRARPNDGESSSEEVVDDNDDSDGDKGREAASFPAHSTSSAMASSPFPAS